LFDKTESNHLLAFTGTSDIISSLAKKYQNDNLHPMTTSINKLKATVKETTKETNLDSDEVYYLKDVFSKIILKPHVTVSESSNLEVEEDCLGEQNRLNRKMGVNASMSAHGSGIMVTVSLFRHKNYKSNLVVGWYYHC
jgi:hypothetical protein